MNENGSADRHGFRLAVRLVQPRRSMQLAKARLKKYRFFVVRVVAKRAAIGI